MPDNKTPKYQYDHYDFGDMLDSAVEAGSKIGSSVLGSIADALAQAGDAMSRPQPDSFAAWKRRLERKWKNGGQTVGVVLTAVGWTFTGCFGITALVMGILTAVGAGPLGLSQQDFIALPILTAVFYPATLGFLFMAIVGMKNWPISAVCASCCALPMTGPATCPRWPARHRSSRKRPMKPLQRLWRTGIFPTLPFPTITAHFTWTIRSCRRRQSPPQRRRPSLPNP